MKGIPNTLPDWIPTTLSRRPSTSRPSCQSRRQPAIRALVRQSETADDRGRRTAVSRSSHRSTGSVDRCLQFAENNHTKITRHVRSQKLPVLLRRKSPLAAACGVGTSEDQPWSERDMPSGRLTRSTHRLGLKLPFWNLAA